MTTSTRKDKSGKTPSALDKKAAQNTVSPEELKRRQEYAHAVGKSLGFKEVPLKGVIIRISEGPLV